uniref:Nicastrin n=1 Tax=Sphaeramia orbicularis TaxID=375764 RepID=A0A673ABB9_9TELE
MMMQQFLPLPGRTVIALLCVGCNSVEKKIYVHLNYTVPCVRLLNATHQIGCQSSLSGNVGVLHVLESEDNLDWVLSKGPNPPYLVILEAALFTRSIMMKLKNGSNRVAGVAVVAPNTNPTEPFSPYTTCPNENTGVYTEKYDPAYAHCNVTVWNPLGNGLAYEEFDFPIFSLKDDNDTQVIRQCFLDHNQVVNGSAPQYPLCAMQLYSHMSAVTDTATCMRRNDINFSISPEGVCDPLGDSNVWASSRPINTTQKGHKNSENVIILDSRSFFFDIAPGAQSSVTGFVSLLAAAHALRNATQEAPPNRTILYTFFQGETFDYIGSSRMVYDMENNQFAVDLDNVHSVLEVGQVGLRSDSQLWLHSDPVSRRNSSVNDEVRKLIENLQVASKDLNVTVNQPQASQPLPPSSFQRFLRARPIPGIVIEDHQSVFTNRYYESMYDNAEYLNISYPSNLTADEQLEHITETATVPFTLSPPTVTRMLYSLLIKSNNSWFQEIIPSEFMSRLTEKPTNFYVGVANWQSSEPTFLVQYLLANLTGTVVNVTKEDCQHQREDDKDKESHHLYHYMWVQGSVPPNGTQRESFCVRSTVHLSKALSPAFDPLKEYTSTEYSTWTESRWKTIKGRIFLVASHELEMLTLGVGVGVLVTSLLLTYLISSKADILFSSGREPTNATY